MITVDPKAIRFLQGTPISPIGETHPKPQEASEAPANEDSSSEVAAEAVSESSPSEASASETTSPATPSHPSKYATKVALRASQTEDKLTPFTLPPYASPFIFIPPYLEVSFATCSAIYVRHPTARPSYSEVPTPYDADGAVVRLAWEWYSKRRVRVRSAKRRAREPENRGSQAQGEIPRERGAWW
jgi:hypothetical protein